MKSGHIKLRNSPFENLNVVHIFVYNTKYSHGIVTKQVFSKAYMHIHSNHFLFVCLIAYDLTKLSENDERLYIE